MKAVILAAGKGTRLLPLTKKIPKPMVMIHGSPILEHVINILPREVTDLIIVTGYLEDKIKEYFGNNFNNKKIKYLTQEIQNGVWKALKLAEQDLQNEEKFLLIFADDLHGKLGLKKLIKEKNAILAFKHSDPTKFGVIKKDQNNFLTNIEEKPNFPKSNLVATGVYVLEPKILKYSDPTPVNGEYFITHVFNQYLKDNKIKVVESDFWQPVGTVEDYVKAHESDISD